MMPSARCWPLCLAGLLFAPLGVIAPKGETPMLLVLAVAALIGALLRRDSRSGTDTRSWNWIWGALAGGVVWGLLSGIWALDPLASLGTAGRMVAVFASAYVLLATSRASTTQDNLAFSTWLIAGFALALTLVAVDLATSLAARSWYYQAIGRPGAFDPTLLNRSVAILLLASWPAAHALYRRGWPKLAVLAPLLAAGTALAGVSSSNKLAASLALLVAAGLWLFRSTTQRIVAIVLLGVLMAAPLLPATVLSPSLLEDRFDDYDSGLHRLYIWEFAASRIAERPVAGWGLDSSPLIPGGEAKLPQGGNRMNVHPHNAFLQVWLELGAVGALILAGLLLTVMRATAEPVHRITAATAGGLLVSTLVVANLSFGLWQTWWMSTLVLAGLLFAAAQRGSDEGLYNPHT